jgi:hypothetical protein
VFGWHVAFEISSCQVCDVANLLPWKVSVSSLANWLSDVYGEKSEMPLEHCIYFTLLLISRCIPISMEISS